MSHFFDCLAYESKEELIVQYIDEPFTNKVLIYPKNAHFKCPEYLKFQKPSDNIYNYDINLEMEICGTKIFSIPIQFMLELNHISHVGDKYYIKIPFNIFMDDLNMKEFKHSDVIFKLISECEHSFTSCSIISKITNKKNFTENNECKEHLVQYINSTKLISETPCNEFIYNNVGNHSHKGFFIEIPLENNGNDECCIKNIELRFDNIHVLHNWDDFLIMNKCIKINSGFYYFPLNPDKSYDDRSDTSLDGSINFSKFTNLHLKINLNHLCNSIRVYELCSNTFVTNAGLAGVKWMPHECHHIKQKYNI